MKRVFSIVMATLTMCILFLSTGCSLKASKIVEDVNKNCNAEIDLLTPFTEDLFGENYNKIEGYGTTGYYDKKYGENYNENSDIINACSVIYHVSCYPFLIFGKQYVTGIDITDPTISVYGYSVGDNAKDMQKFLEEKGLKIFDDAERLKKFQKDDLEIRIGINYEEQTINSIYLGVNATYFLKDIS